MDIKDETITDSYRSISELSTGIYKDNGSKFLSFAYPVESESDIKSILSDIKKEYHDARHHCYAYRLGYRGDVWRANDDGEPSSSAGKPIFGQILSNDLSDILIIVVRYFGGIKLGIPGLIRAYKASSADAIQNAVIIEKIAGKRYKLRYNYIRMNSVMKLLKDLDLPQCSQDFEMDCSIEVKVRLSIEKRFLKEGGDIEGLEIIDLTESNI